MSTIIKIYADWCMYCNLMAPEWDKMKLLLDSLKERDFISLPELILKGESKLAVSVILSAALELNRKGYIEIVQAEQFGEIYFKGSEEAVH